MNVIDTFRRKIFRRRHAYRALLRPDGVLTPAAQIVLADLAKFCRAVSSTTVVSPITQTVDTHASQQAEGRREVWLRITQHLNIDDADLYKLIAQQNDEGEDNG